jgi:hypothetical protein
MAETELDTAAGGGTATVGGKYKYRYAGLRDLYGGRKIGFEIRGGWHSSLGNFRSIIQRLTMMLGAMNMPLSIKRGGAQGSSSFTLLQHFEFHSNNSILANYDVDFELVKKLKDEAKKVSARLPQQLQTRPDALFRRWMLMFAPWEHHPSFVKSSKVYGYLFRHYRNDTIRQLNKYFQNNLPEKPGENISFVSELVQKFFRSTSLYSWL